MASSEHSSSDDHYFFSYRGKTNRKELRIHFSVDEEDLIVPQPGKTKRKQLRVQFSEDEQDLIVRMYKLLGNRWSLIAGRLPGKTAEEIEKYWMEEKNATKKQKELVPHSQSMTESQKQPR